MAMKRGKSLITSSWPAGAMWFDRLKARHAQQGLLSDLTFTYLGQRLQRPQGAFNPNTALKPVAQLITANARANSGLRFDSSATFRS